MSETDEDGAQGRNVDDSFFFWTPAEAEEKQVLQIGVSACGATGVINVLSVLKLPNAVEDICKHVQTRLRAQDAAIPEYLHSRSVAGTTHEDLIAGLDGSTQSKVFARFFSFYPRRDVDLSDWLRSWMKRDVVPVATLNLQRAVAEGYEIPDAWHHQMIYGVDNKKVYMCNPLISEPIANIMEQLCSPSELLIRRDDIMKRYSPDTDLRLIEAHHDVRWREMKVVDQVYNVIDEEIAIPLPPSEMLRILKQHLFTRHVKIPAAYQSGITLCARTDNQASYDALRNAPDLPLLDVTLDDKAIAKSETVCDDVQEK
ncbi:uncharacterized protein [Diadema antillarum]|uniref:uncharacterized protein n=1 Tax=Diadema antillarum TaxID=105358 RepID=UPI003A88D490